MSQEQVQFVKYPSTDDSVESLLHRPESPINRNWSWSPHAPNSHHIIESINYRGDDHPLGNVPYETIEAAEIILPEKLEDTDEENERKQEQQDEINEKTK
jgi:hypothetical protein